MSTQTQPPPTTASAATTARGGWVWFAGIYVGLAGALNLLWGISALTNKDYFHEDGVVFSTLQFWGWVALVIAAIQLIGGGLLLGRRMVGVIMALVIAPLAMLNAFATFGAYPGWSIVALVCNALVLWAVTVHGDEFA